MSYCFVFLSLLLTVVQSNRLSSSHWLPIGCEQSLLENKRARFSPTVTLKIQLKAFRSKVQLSCRAGPAGCGGRRRARVGPDGAGLLGCWATGRPRRGLAEWASSMERLIPARTKSLPVVLLDQRQQENCSESLQQILLHFSVPVVHKYYM